MHLTSFKKNKDTESYHLKFSDGAEFDIYAEELRYGCPCAGCKGEGFLFRQYIPDEKKLPPEAFMLEKAEKVGNYSLRLFWKDGHDTGIYTWEYLKSLNNKIN